MRETDKYQNESAECLESLLRIKGFQPEVKQRWKAFSEYARQIYSPEIDIAVGPFATGQLRYEKKFNLLMGVFKDLIDKSEEAFQSNWQKYYQNGDYIPEDYKNENARCFMAIEIENKNSRKHFMGSIVNAGALGRIGIFVAWNDEVLRAAIRMRKYFEFIKERKQRTFDVGNVLIVSKEQFRDCLEKALRK